MTERANRDCRHPRSERPLEVPGVLGLVGFRSCLDVYEALVLKQFVV